MKFRISVILPVAIPWLLAGCAGVGVVATSDPVTKLNDANYLYNRQDRPLIAERLIWQAMEIFRERQDFHWLGNAHREYADFLLSPAVVRWRTAYSKSGFRDRTITFDGRFVKAQEYYDRARRLYWRAEPILKADEEYSALINLYYNMAYVSDHLGEMEAACGFLIQTLDAHARYIAKNPDAKLAYPSQYESFVSWIHDHMHGTCSGESS